MMPLFLAMNILLELGNSLRGSRVVEAGVLAKQGLLDQKQVEERVWPTRSDWRATATHASRSIKAGHCLAPFCVVARKLPCPLCIAFVLTCFTAVTSGKDDRREGVGCVAYRYLVCPLSGGATYTGSFLLFNSWPCFFSLPHLLYTLPSPWLSHPQKSSTLYILF